MNGKRIIARAAAFLRDEERGSATIWNLFWLCGFGALLGLGLETTAAINTKGKLQMVADTASHAAVMDLFPTPPDAIDTAVDYGTRNIPGHANVVTDRDVAIGHYDLETRTFQTEDVPHYNAVRALATRDSGRENALGTFFLRIVGFYNWDIGSASTALYYSDMSQTDRCRKSGLFAAGTMEQTSNNIITGTFCTHGESGLKINQNNIITCGVELSLPAPSYWMSQSVSTPSGNPQDCIEYNGSNLSNQQMVEQAVVYRSIRNNARVEYDQVKKILDAFIAGLAVNDPFNAIPPYITQYTFTDHNKFNSDARSGKLVAGMLYVVSCSDKSRRLRPEGLLRNIGIYTNCVIDVTKDTKVSALKPTRVTGNYDKRNLCDPDTDTCSEVPWDAYISGHQSCAEAISQASAAGEPLETYATLLDTAGTRTYRDGVTRDTEAQRCPIEPGANGLWDNVFVFNTAFEGGNLSHKAVTFPNNMQIGRLDGCAEGGGARIYAAGSIDTPSGTMMHGSHFVILGNSHLAAKSDGTFGLTVEAAGNISYAA